MSEASNLWVAERTNLSEIDKGQHSGHIYNMEINVAEAKDQFSRCLAKAQAGETVIVRKHGKAIAQITGIPDKPKNRIQFDSAPGSVQVFCDLTEPAIPEEDWDCLQ